MLGLVTVGDGFVYLVLQDRDDLPAIAFPLLAVGTSLSFVILAVPLGRLADRVGRWPVIVIGYACLLAVYLLLAWGHGPLALIVLLYGAFYAATDGVLSALAAPLIPDRPEDHRAGAAADRSGLGLLRLVGGLRRAVALRGRRGGLPVRGRLRPARPAGLRPGAAAHRPGPAHDPANQDRGHGGGLAAADRRRPGVGADPRRATRRSTVDPTITLRTPGVLVRDTETGQLALLKPDGSRTPGQGGVLPRVRRRRPGHLPAARPGHPQHLPAGGAGRRAERRGEAPDQRDPDPGPGVRGRPDALLDGLRLRRLLPQQRLLHPDRHPRPGDRLPGQHPRGLHAGRPEAAHRTRTSGASASPPTTTPSTPRCRPGSTSTWCRAVSRPSPW